ncbi:MAG: hypothetical protein QM683_07690 [Lacrimispora sp.]
MNHSNNVLTREKIYENVWGDEWRNKYRNSSYKKHS